MDDIAEKAADWVRGYVTAWTTNDADDVRRLFADDAVYRFRPDDREPWVGADAIVREWLADPDEDWSFEWHPVAAQGDTATVQGVTVYDDGVRRVVYDNLWVIRLDEAGRAREFTEWFMERRDAEALQAWMDGYLRAWSSSEPEQIRALFTEDAVYRATPHADVWTGIEQIVERWRANADEPGTWDFAWERLALSGTRAVVRGVTTIRPGASERSRANAGVYDNLWVLELAPGGRVREFSDYWVARAG